MPRPTRAQGRPGAKVIPTGWATSHRPVVAKTLVDATVELRHPGSRQGWSVADQQNIEVPLDPYHSGPARLQALATRDQVSVTVGDREVVISYLVVVDADADPAVDDLVTVTAVDDTHLAGRALMVVQVVTGSLRWERDLYCTLTD